MTKRIRARVVVQQRVEYRHVGGQGQGMLMNLALQGVESKGSLASPAARVCGCSSGSPINSSPWISSRRSCVGSNPINLG